MSESNIEKVNPVVEVEIGGKTYQLKFDLWALLKIEEVTGMNVLDGKAWLNPRAKDVVALLWAALLHSDPTLTQETVAKMIDLNDIPGIVDKLASTFEKASAPEDLTKKKESPATANPPPEENAAGPTG